MNRTAAIVGALAALPDGDVSSDVVLERIAARDRIQKQMASDQMRDLATYRALRVTEDRKLYRVGELQVGRTVPLELGVAMRVAPLTAENRVQCAEAVVTDHPALLDLMSAGLLAPGAVGMVAAETAVLDEADRRRVDVQLAHDQEVGDLTPGQLQLAARRRVMAADPEAATKRCAAARADKFVRLGRPVDGTARVVAQLPAEQAQACHDSLEHTARGLRAAGDPRSIEHTKADLFVDACTGSAERPEPEVVPIVWSDPPEADEPDPGPEPSDVSVPDPYDGHEPVLQEPARTYPYPRGVAGQPTEIQVVVDLPTFLGLADHPGMLRGIGALPADTIRDLADGAAERGDATIRRLLCDTDGGRLLTMDSTARCFAGSLRKYVRWRDQADRLTGTQVIREVDHVEPWASQPQTTARNGQGVSRGTNLAKEHPAITAQVLRANAPTVRWHLPTGWIHDTGPPPALGWGSTPAPSLRLVDMGDDDPPPDEYDPPPPDDEWYEDAG